MLGQGSIHSLSAGQLGSKFISVTDTVAGDFGILYAVTDCVVNTLVSGVDAVGNPVMTTNAGSGTMTAFTLIAGQSIYGRFASVKLDSGIMIAYKV